MLLTQPIKSWERFKQVISDCAAKGIAVRKLQLDETSGYYDLALDTGTLLKFELDKTDAACCNDYEVNFQSDFLIVNAQSD